MAEIDDIALPDTVLTSESNNQKFQDVVWRLVTKTGLTKLIAAIAAGVLNRQVPKLGPDWKPIPGSATSAAVEVGGVQQNTANIRGDIAGVAKQVDALAQKVAALPAPQLVLTDAQVTALAQQLTAALGPGIAQQVLAAYQAQITKK